MAKYRDPTTGTVIEIGSPELNPSLVAGKELVPETTPLSTGTITSQDLTPVPGAEFKTLTFSPIETDKDLEVAPIEKKADVLGERILSLQEKLLGKSAFERAREEEFGISALETTEADLTSQLQSLRKRAEELRLQYEQVPDILQQQALGRGITRGGLASLEAGELRKIRLQQGALASESLIISANLDAIQGKLVSAGKKVERAVNAKYKDLEEERDILLQNLEIILKSPAYDRATKARAEQRKERLV